MRSPETSETLDVADARAWRSWLRENHLVEPDAMLVFRKGGVPSISCEDAFDEALAYGWIDIIVRRIDEERYV